MTNQAICGTTPLATLSVPVAARHATTFSTFPLHALVDTRLTLHRHSAKLGDWRAGEAQGDARQLFEPCPSTGFARVYRSNRPLSTVTSIATCKAGQASATS